MKKIFLFTFSIIFAFSCNQIVEKPKININPEYSKNLKTAQTFFKLFFSRSLVFKKIINVTTNKIPLTVLWENSISSGISESSGITLPLHVGHVDPQPSPDPVALTIAPANIEEIARNNPARTEFKRFMSNFQ